jgi:signal transduction histidine kinase
MYTQNLLTALALLAACAAVVWLRTGHSQPAKTRRERLREVGWCTGFLLIALTVAGAFRPRRVIGLMTSAPQPRVTGLMTSAPQPHATSEAFSRPQAPAGPHGSAVYLLQARTAAVTHVVHASADTAYFTFLSISLAAAIVLVLRPSLGRRLVPVSLIGVGLAGLVAARDHGFWSRPVGSFLSLLPFGQYNMQYYLILPLAYALLVLGGALLWRGLDRTSPITALALGGLGDPRRRGVPWALLLLPVTLMATALLFPGTWFGGGVAGGIWTAAVLAAAVLVIWRYPDFAAGLATAGLAVIAAFGLQIANAWPSWPGPRTPDQYVLSGVVAVASRPMADLAAVQGLILLGFAVWLAPRTIPQLRPLLGLAANADLVHRVQRLTESRNVAVDTAAADLRRLERDLHDGAQARLVALGMHLRAVEKLIPTSPDAALALVAEARETSARALTDLRELVRGVHPPVLADRGLGDAVRALALDTPLRIETEVSLPSRLPAPIETACYFAVAEVLTNAVKHSGAREARISVTHAGGVLRIGVTDFGIGGADVSRGTGLAGVEKRLATFDGIMAVSSPVGGPTMVVMEVPCASSSLKTSSC